MFAPQTYTFNLQGFRGYSDLGTKGSTDVLTCLKTAAVDQAQMSLEAVKQAVWEMITTIVFDTLCKKRNWISLPAAHKFDCYFRQNLFTKYCRCLSMKRKNLHVIKQEDSFFNKPERNF
jgi:hypothetical protein